MFQGLYRESNLEPLWSFVAQCLSQQGTSRHPNTNTTCNCWGPNPDFHGDISAVYRLRFGTAFRNEFQVTVEFLSNSKQSPCGYCSDLYRCFVARVTIVIIITRHDSALTGLFRSLYSLHPYELIMNAHCRRSCKANGTVYLCVRLRQAVCLSFR
jgi:hypothetical protein